MDIGLAILVGALGVQAPDVGADQASAIFDTLVQHYRQFVDYEDRTAVVETVTRESQEPHRVETRIACRIENEHLRIDSPGAQLRGGVGLPGPVARSDAMESLALRYNLWIAPHMALRFKEDPLAEFRLGVPQGFVVAGAEQTTWHDRPLVRIELKAAGEPSADAPDAVPAQYDLWVNPDSMLVERVTGSQTLPDGAQYATEMDIEVIRANGVEGH